MKILSNKLKEYATIQTIQAVVTNGTLSIKDMDIHLIPPHIATEGMVIAFIIATVAALLFPAEAQSKLWIKIFGAEWGAMSNGRIWTFLSVFITATLVWGFLIWIPSNS